MLEAKQVTATRPRRSRINAVETRRTSASLPEWPSTMALVKSQIIASTPSLAERRECRLVRRRPDQRLGIQLPIAGVQQHAVGVSITSACASGMECVTRRNCSLKGARSN